MNDLWAQLEVQPGADEVTIKKSYRRLVLKYHPDKHPDDRETAEAKIREINAAYETLGNPSKRAAYEQQAAAMQKKRQGVRLDTSGIRPRMSIPKEFMMVPSGYIDKFVRTCGSQHRMSAFVHNREDAKNVPFREFVEAARFTLWWVPQGVNNCCRVKWHPGDGGSSTYVGMNMHFELSPDVSESPITLNPGEDPHTSNVIVVASPEFAGAYRFESAYYPGHYLAFKPPTHLRMVNCRDDQTVLDFILADYQSAGHLITVEEVLIPVVASMGGEKNFISLGMIQADINVQRYFRQLGQAGWQIEDFETYFEGHWDRWDYNKQCQSVRVRGHEEKLGYTIQCAKSSDEVAGIVADAGDALKDLVLDKVEIAMRMLADVDSSDASGGVALMVNRHIAQKLILQQFLRRVCLSNGADVSLERLLSMRSTLPNFGGQNAKSEILGLRSEAVKEAATKVSTLLDDSDGKPLEFDVLLQLADLDLEWETCSTALIRRCEHTVAVRSLEQLMPLLKKALAAKAGAFAEFLANSAMRKIASSSPAAVAEALEALVGAGHCLDTAASTLRSLLSVVPVTTAASIVASLGERGVESADLRACAEGLGAARDALPMLPAATLTRLAVASAKSAAVAEACLPAVCVAVVSSLGSVSWSVDDIAKLLNAVSKPKGTSPAQAAASDMLFKRAAEVLSMKLGEMTSVQLIKIVVAVGKVPVCRPLLEAAAVQATARTSDMPPAQLMLLTQGFLPLGASNKAFQQIVSFWSQSFSDALERDTGDAVSQRRVALEAKAELSPDQMAKLSQLLAPVVPDHGIFESMARRLLSGNTLKPLTEAGMTALKNAFPEHGGPSFRSRDKLLQAARSALNGELGTSDRGGRDRRRGSSSRSSSRRRAKRRR